MRRAWEPFVIADSGGVSETMDRLYFGARARRRLRRKRVKRAAVVLWIVAMGAGVPGATAILDWTESAIGGRRPVVVGAPDPLQGGVIHAKGLKGELHTDWQERRASPDPLEANTTTGVIYAAANEFGLDPAYLLSVATCESGLDPAAYNPAGYHGLFQFDQTTWAAYGYGSIYDAVAQARTAARLLAAGHASRWPNCA